MLAPCTAVRLVRRSTPSDLPLLSGGLRCRDSFKAESTDRPTLSVIVVTRNAEDSIERTLRSILRQRYEGLELVVVDGASRDATLEIIRKYEHGINVWLSEPDRGIYDAMNKGIRLASGGYLMFINAGDRFRGPVLASYRGGACLVPVKYRWLGRFIRRRRVTAAHRGVPYCHQGIVFAREGLRFDLRYRLASDFESMTRSGAHGSPLLRTRGYVYYDNTGLSRQNVALRDAEVAAVIREHFGSYHERRFRRRVRRRLLAERLLARAWRGSVFPLSR